VKVIINEVPTEMPELEIFKLVNTEWVQIPETEGIFCWHCNCPVRFNMHAPGQMMGKCQNCQHVMMQHRTSPKVAWDNAAVVMFKVENNRLIPVCSHGEITA
jgi:hypothetical protein